MVRLVPSLLVLLTTLVPATAQATWQPAPAPLATRWFKEVTPQNVWPEYPRPTLRRAAWHNLDGLWDYAITAGDAVMPEKPDGQILVPFAVESSLSGVGRSLRPDQRLWYRRTFTLPDDEAWRGKNVLLHCDAIDWESEVWVDGTRIGDHRGGYDRFSFDVTAALGKGKDHELRIGVRDPSDTGPQPRGKQVQQPNGIWYTPSSGIWQTVWLEPVPATYVRSVRWTADPASKTYHIEPDLVGLQPGDRWAASTSVEALLHQPIVVREEAAADVAAIDLASDLFQRWSLGHPFLQPIELAILRDGKPIDTVHSYVAMRELRVGTDAGGTTRLLLNGEPVFQFGPLDQGFWPDGLYTPPSHAAMCADLDAIVAMGCNMLRKHVKVESELYYHECDKRGILVWQDMPSGDLQKDPANFARELRALIDTHRQHPSIVMWVVFNEGWGQHDTKRYVDLVRQWDPTRWIGNASGWTDAKCGDVIDVHVYPGPGMAQPEPERASVLGEFGGLGLPLDGHTWAKKDNWGYVSFRDRDELTREYVARLHELRPLIAQGLSAAVYTQTTDVEIECNGWLTYDRAVVKIDPQLAAAAAMRLYERPGSVRTIVATAEQSPQPWRWTTRNPGAGWAAASFDDRKWTEGPGGFGTPSTPGSRIGTEWKTTSIWLRRTIELPEEPLVEPFFRLHHDEDVEVFVDGEPVLTRSGFTTNYVYAAASEAARRLLTPGRHVLAVHCRQTGGGQYIDVGLVDLVPRHAKRRPR